MTASTSSIRKLPAARPLYSGTNYRLGNSPGFTISSNRPLLAIQDWPSLPIAAPTLYTQRDQSGSDIMLADLSPKP